jgi:hypothetical protein
LLTSGDLDSTQRFPGSLLGLFGKTRVDWHLSLTSLSHGCRTSLFIFMMLSLAGVECWSSICHDVR